jgi:hypothetical protein
MPSARVQVGAGFRKYTYEPYTTLGAATTRVEHCRGVPGFSRHILGSHRLQAVVAGSERLYSGAGFSRASRPEGFIHSTQYKIWTMTPRR